jgi:hypothetical protein
MVVATLLNNNNNKVKKRKKTKQKLPIGQVVSEPGVLIMKCKGTETHFNNAGVAINIKKGSSFSEKKRLSFLSRSLSFFPLIMFSSMKGSFCLFLLLSSAVQAQVESPSHNYNVTLPEPNTPYVAGQMLPISYTLPNDANLSKRNIYI